MAIASSVKFKLHCGKADSGSAREQVIHMIRNHTLKVKLKPGGDDEASGK